MILYVNEKNEIKDVGTTTDESLIEYVVNDEENPFAGWSIAKICCFRAKVEDGIVTMYTPYVDSRLIEHIDQLGKANASTQAQLDYVTMMSDIEMQGVRYEQIR